MKKIRVLHIIDTTGPGGAEKVICDIVKKLDRRKFISFLIIPDKGWYRGTATNYYDTMTRVMQGKTSSPYVTKICRLCPIE